MRNVWLVVLCLMLALPALAATPKKTAKPSSAKPRTEQPASSSVPAPRPVFDTDGSFGFCLVDYVYPDNRKLTVARSPADEVNLGLTIPNANFSLGSHYDLAITLMPEKGKEPGAERAIRATAIHENALLLQMGANPAFIKALTSSKSLHVTGGGKKMDFPTPGIGFAYNALRKCLDANQGKKDPGAAMTEQALPETLKAVLIAAGLKDIVPLRLDDIPTAQRPADFIWQTGALTGGVRERLAPPGKTLTDLIGLHIQGLKRKCKGAFNADVGREVAVAGLTLRPVDVECHVKGPEDEKNIIVAIVFFVNPANRFTVFTHEGDGANKAEAIAARDAIQRTLIQLAKQVETKQASGAAKADGKKKTDGAKKETKGK